MSPDVMLLMETKKRCINEKLQSLQYPHYFSIPPNDLSGSLSTMWKESVDITVLESSLNLIDAKITHNSVSSFVTFIYGALHMENRASLWNKLTHTGLGRDSPWLITRVINDIVNSTKKIGGPPLEGSSFSSFRSVVVQNGLWDLKHPGNQLSWIGTRHSHFIGSRLDRSIGNYSWSETFPLGRCCYHRFEGSYHRPLMTYFKSNRHKHQSMFRFDWALTEKQEIVHLVESAWSQSPL